MRNLDVHCLMISDVPGDNPAVIGSGLLFPDSLPSPAPDLPKKWQVKLSSTTEVIQPPASFRWEIIASNNIALQAASQAAQKLGYSTQVQTTLLCGDAEKTARRCIQELDNNPEKLLIWGAETTVTLPENPGKGGRNQHLALAAAIHIADRNDITLLSAGTELLCLSLKESIYLFYNLIIAISPFMKIMSLGSSMS